MTRFDLLNNTFDRLADQWWGELNKKDSYLAMLDQIGNEQNQVLLAISRELDKHLSKLIDVVRLTNSNKDIFGERKNENATTRNSDLNV